MTLLSRPVHGNIRAATGVDRQRSEVGFLSDIRKDPFSEYIRHIEPGRRELGYAWYTAIGLQAVDGRMLAYFFKIRC